MAVERHIQPRMGLHLEDHRILHHHPLAEGLEAGTLAEAEEEAADDMTEACQVAEAEEAADDMTEAYLVAEAVADRTRQPEDNPL